MMALIGAPSRFSVLKTDVADPTEGKKPLIKNLSISATKKQQQQGKQAQQQSKKNAKNNSSANNSNSKKKLQKPEASNSKTEKFDEWKKRDEKLMDSTYEKDLHQALMMSRLEQELEKEQRSDNTSPDLTESKKKGKVTLSLQAFYEKFIDEAPVSRPARTEPLSKLLAMRKEEEEKERKLRQASEREVSAIVTKEKIQQEFIDKASQPKVVPQEEYDQMLEMKRKQIEHMAKVLNSTNKELAVLQEQNADFERLLTKSEQKKKIDLVREVEELRQVKDELTQEIQTLHAALEQEKSKTNQLTKELQKRR